MTFLKFLFQDWNINKGNPKGKIFLVLFRIANFCSTRKIYFYIGIPYLIVYKVIIQWVFALEVPWAVKIGKNLSLYHGQSLIINKHVIIGENCTIRHCTTLGTKRLANGNLSDAPIIGNNVDVGSNVCIIGPIRIADNVKIGSGSVVVKDVQANSIVYGNPAIQKEH